MPTDLTSVQPKYDMANQAGQAVASMTEASGGLEKSLREAVSERFSSSPLFKQRETAAQDYITSVPKGREEMANLVQGGTILSPNQQQSILASKQASSMVPLLSLNDLLQAQTGGMENAIQGGLGAFNSLLSAQSQRAGLLQQDADSSFNRLLQQAQMEEEQRQFDETSRLRGMEIAKGGAGGGGGGGMMDWLMSQIRGGQAGGQEQDVGEGPSFMPSSNGEKSYDDETGVVWQFQDTQWVPIGRQ